MANTIERNITEMTLDPKGFKAGVSKTLRYISDLKKALTFSGGIRNMGELDRASSKIKFDAMARGVDNVTTRISAMGIVGATVINNLTNSVLNSAKKMFKQLAMDPLTSGLAEYETQMGAIQTILANTASKGSTLTDVNAALDELNLYADLTIYNFTNMTDSIGKFTAAGVALDTSVSAIKGISNLAAISGSNSQQASTAMYQLSQAISTGTLKLQDWNSVVNAGMGGEIFQDALKQTARVHGVAVDSFIEQDGSFRDSLQRGWITADILLETLSQYTGDLSDEMLASMGYTQEQIVEIQKTAVLASDAATKIKTLSQLKDTMAEALGSGWSQTWRLIFGDFEEAKVLFGELGDIFGGLIESSSTARNYTLEMWNKFGGRDSGISAFISILKTGIRVGEIFGSAMKEVFPPVLAGKLYFLTKKFEEFAKGLEVGAIAGNRLKRFFRGLFAILDIGRLSIMAVVDQITYFVSKFAPAGGTVLKFASNFGDMISGFRDFLVESDFFDMAIETILTKLEKLVEAFASGAEIVKTLANNFLALDVVQTILGYFRDAELSDFMTLLSYGTSTVRLFGIAFRNMFPEPSENPIRKVTKDFTALVEKIRPSSETLIKFYRVFRGVLAIVDIGRMLFVSIGEAIFDAFSKADVGSTNFLEFMATIGDSIYNLRNFIKQSGFFDGIMDSIGQSVGKAIEAFKKFNPIFSWIGDKIPVVMALFSKLWDVIVRLKDSFNLTFTGPNIMDFFKSFSNSDSTGVKDMADDLESVAGSVEKVSSGLGILGWLAEALGPTFAAVGLDSKKWIADFITNLTEGNVNLNVDFSWLTALLNAGIIVAILRVVKKVKDFFSGGGWFGDILDKYIGADSPLISGLTGTFDAIQGSMVAFQNNIKVEMLLKIAAAIAIITVSIVALSMISPEKLATAVGAITLLMVELFGGTGVLSKISIKNMAATSASMLALSVALLVMTGALAALSRIKGDDLKMTLEYVAIALTELVLAIKILGTGSAKDTLEAAVSLVVISGALLLLSKAILAFGKMDPDTMEAGLLSIGAALVGFVAFTKLIKGNKIIEISLGLGAMAIGLKELGDAIAKMGSMSWEEMLKGLTTMGVALGILAVAVKLMQGTLAGAAAIVVVSLGVIVLSKALTILGRLSIEELLTALAGLAGIFVVLGLAGVLMAPIVPVLMSLGIAFGLIGLAALGLGVGLFLAATGLVALAAAGAGIGAVIGIVATALIEVLPKAAAALAEGIVNFIETIASNSQRVLEAAKTLILTMVQAFTETTPAILVAVFDMVGQILTTILERAPEMLQTGFDILIAFLDGIGDNIALVVEKAVYVATEFMRGLEEQIPALIEAGYRFAAALAQAILDAIVQHAPELWQGMVEMAENLVNGITAGITAGIERVKASIRDLGLAAIQALVDLLGISSPSKVAKWIFRMFTDGAVLGVEDGTGGLVSAMTTMAEKAQNGMNNVLAAIDTSIADNMAFVPVISPVLDLTDLNSGMRGINRSFAGANISASVSDGLEGKNSTDDTTVSGQSNGGGVTFIQHNNSPKALSTSEVYRQTRTLVGKLKTAGVTT